MLAPVKPGQLQEIIGRRYIVYRTTFKPYESQQKKGGVLTFKSITGKAEVWMDGKMIGAKSDVATTDWTVNFPSGIGERVLSVLVEAEHGNKAGLGGVVSVKAD